jgi:plasmid maintenance system antidote protein VapI
LLALLAVFCFDLVSQATILPHPCVDPVRERAAKLRVIGIEHLADPLWGKVRKHQPPENSQAWIQMRVRNAIEPMEKIGLRLFRLPQATFRRYIAETCPERYRGSLVSYLSDPSHLIRSENFRSVAEWLTWHIVNNPWGWSRTEIASKIGMDRKNLSRFMNGSRGASIEHIVVFADVLRASRAEAFEAGRLIYGPVDLFVWLNAKFEERSVKPTVFASKNRIPISELYEVLGGRRFPSRRTLRKFAIGLSLSETEILLHAGYLPELDYFAVWARSEMAKRNWTPAFLSEVTGLSVMDLHRILNGRFAARHEVVTIGSALGDKARALIEANMNPGHPPFLEWFQNYYEEDSETPERDLAEQLGLPQRLINRIFEEDSEVPPWNVLQRMADRWNRPEEEARVAGGYLKRPFLPTRTIHNLDY